MINDSETRQLSSEHNLLRAARHIFTLGPKALVIKRGEYGAMLVHQNRTFQRSGVSARGSPRSDRRGRHVRRRIHGLSGQRAPSGRCGVAPRDGLRLGDGKLYGGKIRPGPSARVEAIGNHRPRQTFSQDDAIWPVTAPRHARPSAGKLLVTRATAFSQIVHARGERVVYFYFSALFHAETSQAAGTGPGKHDRRGCSGKSGQGGAHPAGVRKPEQLDYRVMEQSGQRKPEGYFSAPLKTRLAELQDALMRREVRGVFCTRGGYGSAELLEG